MKSVYSSTTVIEFEPLEGVMLLEGGGGGLMEGQLESPGSGGTPVPQWELISVTKFVWDGWNLTAELNGEDEIVRTYAWGLDISGSEQGAGSVGGLLFEQDGDGGPVHRASTDGNGNVMTLRDATGALIAGYEYGPFGEALTVRGSYAGINPFRFSTKYNDSESGLYYYGYRYFSAGMGRWISRDPIGENDTAGLHVFCHNSPVAHFDSLGMLTVPATPEFAFRVFSRSWSVIISMKSYINTVGANIGWFGYLPEPYFSRAITAAQLTDQQFSENPRSPLTTGDYRLFSQQQIVFDCDACDRPRLKRFFIPSRLWHGRPFVIRCRVASFAICWWRRVCK